MAADATSPRRAAQRGPVLPFGQLTKGAAHRHDSALRRARRLAALPASRDPGERPLTLDVERWTVARCPVGGFRSKSLAVGAVATRAVSRSRASSCAPRATKVAPARSNTWTDRRRCPPRQPCAALQRRSVRRDAASVGGAAPRAARGISGRARAARRLRVDRARYTGRLSAQRRFPPRAYTQRSPLDLEGARVALPQKSGYAIVEGRFDPNQRGNMGLFAGGIDQIDRLTPDADPRRAHGVSPRAGVRRGPPAERCCPVEWRSVRSLSRGTDRGHKFGHT